MSAWRTVLLTTLVAFVVMGTYGVAYQQSLQVSEIGNIDLVSETIVYQRRSREYSLSSMIPGEYSYLVDLFFAPAYFIDQSFRPTYWMPQPPIAMTTEQIEFFRKAEQSGGGEIPTGLLKR